MVEDKLVNGSITANAGTVLLNVEGMASAGIQISGTFVGTFVFEGTINGTDWSSLPLKVPSTGAEASSATSTGLWLGSTGGLMAIRVRCSAYTSGTANISLRASLAGGGSGGAFTSDVQIGAVEIKNSTDDTRASVGSNGLHVDNRPHQTIGDVRAVVTTAGTRVDLASSTASRVVVITAETDNTGTIVVGGSTVVAVLATRRGTPLSPGDSVSINIDNLSDVKLDSTVSGDGVTFTYTV